MNLLSTRQLAEKFIDAHGNPDKQTRIGSRYSTHVLTWSFCNYKKTFPTPLSGLPELFFDKGFQAYKLFCIQILLYAMTSDTNYPSSIIPFDNNEVQQLMANDDKGINMLFMSNKTVIFKDGKAIN